MGFDIAIYVLRFNDRNGTKTVREKLFKEGEVKFWNPEPCP